MSAKTVSKTKNKKRPSVERLRNAGDEILSKHANVGSTERSSVNVKESKPKKEAVLKLESEIIEKKGEEIEITEDKEDKSGKKEKYFQTVGRRKESVAIIRLFTKKSTDIIEGDYALIRINDKDYREYFSNKILQGVVESPLRKLKSLNRFKATVLVKGGGLSGQADSIKHGLAREIG